MGTSVLKQLWFSACHSNSGICQAYNKFLCMFACIWDAQQLIREERSSFSKKKIASIIDEIYDPQYGARPIERYINDNVEPEIINQLINNA